jgi:hypothetical protein
MFCNSIRAPIIKITLFDGVLAENGERVRKPLTFCLLPQARNNRQQALFQSSEVLSPETSPKMIAENHVYTKEKRFRDLSS